MKPEIIRVGIVQRVLPGYRAEFFDTLAGMFPGGVSVFAGFARPDEMVSTEKTLQKARFVQAENHHILSGGFYLCWQGGLLEWLSGWDPDVLVMEANPRYLSSPAAIRWMQRRRRKVIGWGLGAPAIHGFAAGLRNRLRSRFFSQFDALIAYSRTGADQYAAGGFPKDRIFVAANASAHRPGGLAPERIPHEGIRVLYVGRLQERKRVDLLLKACAALSQGSQPDLWIVGDGPARVVLETLAQNIYPSARFLGDQRGDALAEFFRGVDLFVLPGTGGLAVQEAMAAGLPVIVAEGDGTQGDLVRPENGWLIPPGDHATLASVLSEAIREPDRLRQMGMASRRIVSEEINLETMAEAYARAIHITLGETPCTS